MPPDTMKRPAMKKVMHCVKFLGHDFAWILEHDLKPYVESEKLTGTKKKSGSMVKAIREITDAMHQRE